MYIYICRISLIEYTQGKKWVWRTEPFLNKHRGQKESIPNWRYQVAYRYTMLPLTTLRFTVKSGNLPAMTPRSQRDGVSHWPVGMYQIPYPGVLMRKVILLR